MKWLFWKKKPEEYHGFLEWVGEEFCIVCDKEIYYHSDTEIKNCIDLVKAGYRLA